MAPRGERGSTLSAQRAFVVHLSMTGRRRRRFSGRVEHLSSGQTVHFSSLKGLVAFLTAVLDSSAHGASGDGVDGQRDARGPP